MHATRISSQHLAIILKEQTMVAIVNRRALVMGSIISSTLCSSSVLVEDVVKFIATSSPRAFREAVAQQGTFLYRGEPETNAMAGQLCSPEPDLLLERTYNDVKALEYFQCLEEYLASQQVIAKPSTGHIGTSNKRNAQEWGNVVSVWPLGTDLSYVYPKRRREFFSSSNSFCRDEEFCINQNLERALQEGREVLFASWYGSTMNVPTSSFLAVPQKYDKRLEGLLESINYGLN
jgi:hypothetical protein